MPEVFGAIEMFRTQREVTRGEPFSRPAMQFCAPRHEQGAVDPFSDERMCEKVALALGSHEQMDNQLVASIPRISEQRPQGSQGKLLAEYGRSLDRLPVLGGKPVTRASPRLCTGRYALFGGFFCGAQRLHQEQLIPRGSLDAALGNRRADDVLPRGSNLIGPQRGSMVDIGLS